MAAATAVDVVREFRRRMSRKDFDPARLDRAHLVEPIAPREREP